MDNITAVLFCGGRGTRLYPVTDYYQKVMMPLGNKGRPMLEYVIQWLKKMGITKFVALIQYRANQIRRYFGEGSRFGVEIKYVLDDPDYKGTGGALLNAASHIKTDKILIYYTDILSNINIISMYERHQKHGKIGTAFIDPSWTINEGIIKHEDNKVEEIYNMLNGEIYANTGISILDSKIFEIMRQNKADLGKKIDLSANIFPLLAESDNMYAYISDSWWLDVGSLSRHQLIDEELLEDKFGGLFD